MMDNDIVQAGGVYIYAVPGKLARAVLSNDPSNAESFHFVLFSPLRGCCCLFGNMDTNNIGSYNLSSIFDASCSFSRLRDTTVTFASGPTYETWVRPARSNASESGSSTSQQSESTSSDSDEVRRFIKVRAWVAIMNHRLPVRLERVLTPHAAFMETDFCWIVRVRDATCLLNGVHYKFCGATHLVPKTRTDVGLSTVAVATSPAAQIVGLILQLTY
jgi:hypothetical protein